MERAQLASMLAKLDQAIPGLLRDYPDDADFWPAFAGEADVIEDAAGAEDFAWVSDQIDELLAKHGLSPRGDAPPTDGWPA